MKRRKQARIAALLLAAVFVGYGGAEATTLERLSLETLTALSSHVLRGRFVEMESAWNEDKTAIYTRVKFRVEQKVAGDVSRKEIIVYLPGGIVGDTTQVVVGAPDIEVGKEAVLMLSAVEAPKTDASIAAGRSYNVVGLSQGVFDLKRDPKTDQVIATSHAMKFFVGSPDAALLSLGGAEGMPLEVLTRRIREIRSGVVPRDAGEAQEVEGQEEIGARETEGEEGKAEPVKEEER